MSDERDAVSRRLRTDIVASLGDSWAKFTPEERKLVEDSTEDAAAYTLASIAGVVDPQVKAEIDATLANIKAAGSKRVQDALWSVVGKVLLEVASIIKL